MSNRYFVGGNWKLNGTRASIEALVKTYNAGGDIPASVEVVVAPTALHIGYVQEHMRKDVAVSAQNVSTDDGFGAMTGYCILYSLFSSRERIAFEEYFKFQPCDTNIECSHIRPQTRKEKKHAPTTRTKT